MTWDSIKSNWATLQNDAKRAWPRLNEAELEVINGDRHKLIDKVRDTQGLSHEDAAQEVEAWRQSLR